MICGVEQREKNNNITRNSSRSDILKLLTLLSADAKPASPLRVLSLTKVSNFPLPHFSKWLCLVHGQLAMSLRCVKRPVICKCQYFCLFDIQHGQLYRKYYFLCQRNPPRRDSPKCQLSNVSILNFHSPKY